MSEQQQMTNQEWIAQLRHEFDKDKIPYEPTCGSTLGIRFDFCRGLRLYIPESVGDRKLRLQVIDLSNDIKVFDDILTGGDYFVTQKRYFVNFGFKLSDANTGESIIIHNYCAKKQKVIIDIPVQTMGDNIAWFSYCDAFRKKHECDLYVCMPKYIRELFEKEYPEIHFIDSADKISIFPYASYTVALFGDHKEDRNNPVDYRKVPLHHYSAYILGLDPVQNETIPKITIAQERIIQEPYVCIASQASGLCKMWNHPFGWTEVIDYLKHAGYRVIDIDRDIVHGNGIHWNWIPRNAEDFTGNHPLSQRASLIANADFFIGLGSGLSWLAWCCKKPVVLISGFSMPTSEFYTPYRVINLNVCHGCYSDTTCEFVNTEYDWCPRHKGTIQHYECSRGITSKAVIEKIIMIPEFQNQLGKINKQEKKDE